MSPEYTRGHINKIHNELLQIYKARYANPKEVLYYRINELVREGVTREEAILTLYKKEEEQRQVKKEKQREALRKKKAEEAIERQIREYERNVEELTTRFSKGEISEDSYILAIKVLEKKMGKFKGTKEVALPIPARAIDIEEYVRGRRAPISLERLFADVLKSPYFVKFKPEEIELKRDDKFKMSDVAGALSRLIIGIGWIRIVLPTTAIAFHSCPVDLGVFSNDADHLKARFLFPIPYRPRKWDMYICGKGSGIFGSGELAELEIQLKGKFSPGLEKIRTDQSLKDGLLKLFRKDLISPYSIDIKYGVEENTPFGWIELKVDNSKKKWKKKLREWEMKPEDFVVELFNNVCSIIRYVRNAFGHAG